SNPVDVQGTNVMHLLPPEDLGDAGEILDFAIDYDDDIMGPVSMRYLDGSGLPRITDIWTTNHLHDDIGGLVMVLSEEAAQSRLFNAVRAIAAGEPIDVALTEIANALRAHPTAAEGFFVAPSVDGVLRPLTSTPLPEVLTSGEGPWLDAFHSGHPVDAADLAELEPQIQDAAHELGLNTVWVRPVLVDEIQGPVACLVAWRERPGDPSPNQTQLLDRAAETAALAFLNSIRLQALTQAALRDPLTGLANRAGLTRTSSAIPPPDTAVLYLDLDGFKPINDNYGHAVGDELLVELSHRLEAALRDDDLRIRVGGDEFVVICAGLRWPDQVEALIGRLIMTLQMPHSLHDGDVEVSVGVSVGAARADGQMTVEQLMHGADRALYRAKEAGGGTWRLAET
ncbi:MAG: GGDEF domain-containing protein, partial [Acidimicrobiia bacterium]|nr:GGDEF domain-containing protein [Acidimicrobiia bacterium]